MGHYCKLCSKPVIPIGNAVVLAKHDVGYYQCSRCSFIQTDEPYWLDEAYSSAITSSDIGLIGRNISFSRLTASVISLLFQTGRSFVDYGGGYGMFVRLMRDKGYNFYWQDNYAENLFAKGFEAKPTEKFDLLTAFELFEHLIDPLQEVEKMLSYSKNILFSTTIVPQPTPRLGSWWYYGLEHGQHIALYSLMSLQEIGNHFGLNFYTNGSNLHLLTEKKISPKLFHWVLKGRIATLMQFVCPRPSLLTRDFYQLTGIKLK